MGTQLQRDVYNDLIREFKPQTDLTPQTNFTPQTNSKPETNFRPQTNFSSVATPGANAPAGPRPEQRKRSASDAHLPYEQDMRAAADKYGVPYDAIYGILKTESNFNPNAVPRDPNTGEILSSARGIAQYIKGTAAQTGLDPTDPKASIYRTAQDLRTHLDKFGRDLRLATASHGVGPGAANSPEGFAYADKVSKNFPDESTVSWGQPHMETPATPGSSIGQRQPSLAGMSEEQLSAVNAGLPESRRSIQTIRGNNVGWFNPQQEREFGSLGESMRGMPGGPTYEGQRAEQMVREGNTARIQAGVAQEEAKTRGSLTELNRAAELAGEVGKPKSAVDVLAAVEGGGTAGVGVRTPAVPNGPEPWKPPLSKEDQEGYDTILSQLDKEKERKRKEQELLSQVPASLRGWYEDNY